MPVALVTNTADAGVASGVQVDATNSAVSGDAFTVFAAGTNVTYTSSSIRGTLGIQVAAAASASTYFSWQGITGNTNAAAILFKFRMPSLPGSSSQPIVYFRSSTGGTGLFVLQLQNASGRLFVTSDAAGGATVGTATNGLSAGTDYWVSVQATNNSGTTTDTITVKAAPVSTGVYDSNLGLSSTTANLGTSTIGAIRFGRPASIGQAFTAIFDDLAFQTGSSTEIPQSTFSDSTTVSPTAIGDGAAVGTPAVSMTITVAPTEIASAADFGAPVVTAPPPPALVPDSITSEAAFGSPTITTTVSVEPPSIASEAALGEPTIEQLVELLPDGIGSGGIVPEPTISMQSVMHRFVPPFVVRSHRIAGALFGALQYGLTVLRIGGEYVEAEFPSREQEDNADQMFLGGTINYVDDATASDLLAAGYTVTTEYV